MSKTNLIYRYLIDNHVLVLVRKLCLNESRMKRYVDSMGCQIETMIIFLTCSIFYKKCI